MSRNAIGLSTYSEVKVKKRTSIGASAHSRPRNKHKRRSWKKYRGQGK
jgi:hypothetical protein